MSIANLLVPNQYDVFANILHVNIIDITGDSQSYSSPLGGALAGQGTVTGFFTKLGKIATLQVNGFSVPAGSSGPIIFTTNLPSPSKITTNIPINVQNNGTFVAGTINIDTNGLAQLFVGYNGNFTSGVVDGWPAFTISYLTA